MTEIATMFKSKIYFNKDNSMNLQAQTHSNHSLVKSYFDKFPLMTSKYLDYLSFIQGLSYLGKSLTEEEIIKIQIIKNSMNSKRVYYNWDYLNNFYK